MCLSALFFLDAPIRVDSNPESYKDNLRQIQTAKIPRPKYAGIIREETVHVDKNNTSRRIEILYQGSPRLATNTVEDARQLTQDIRDRKTIDHMRTHHQDMNDMYYSMKEEYENNEQNQKQREKDMVTRHEKGMDSMKKTHHKETKVLERDIEKAMRSSSDSD